MLLLRSCNPLLNWAREVGDTLTDPDWDFIHPEGEDLKESGDGLFGCSLTDGPEALYFDNHEKRFWMVVEADDNQVVQFDGEHKFPSCEIKFIGDLERALTVAGNPHQLNPDWAYHYARYVLKQRWPEVEELILTGPKWTYLYARYVINGPWPQAEDYLKNHPLWWLSYRHRYPQRG